VSSLMPRNSSIFAISIFSYLFPIAVVAVLHYRLFRHRDGKALVPFLLSLPGAFRACFPVCA
jgi:hypothetical protein